MDNLNKILDHIVPLKGDDSEMDALLRGVGNSRVVMIGEMTHGTDEFYRYRAELTKRLITQKGFTFVAIEGDWPDAYRVNRYVQAAPSCTDTTAVESLGDFQRYPKWMWRNYIVEEFVTWLKVHNEKKKVASPVSDKATTGMVGFYGLDLYALFSAAEKVITYLDTVDKNAAERARKRYGTLNRYRGREIEYGKDVAAQVTPSREKEVVAMLVEMIKNGMEYIQGNGGYVSGEEFFCATENARVVKDAEEYYRKSYLGGNVTWNIRDAHMCETLVNLFGFYEGLGYKDVKAVLWAHNSHLGDARATQFGEGEYNLGQLVREKFGVENTFNVGFSTYSGTVTGSLEWGWPYEFFPLSASEADTYEALFHQVFPGNFLLFLHSHFDPSLVSQEVVRILMPARFQRMIGVNYRQETERKSHYVLSCLPYQFDAVVHFDETTALLPLDT